MRIRICLSLCLSRSRSLPLSHLEHHRTDRRAADHAREHLVLAVHQLPHGDLLVLPLPHHLLEVARAPRPVVARKPSICMSITRRQRQVACEYARAVRVQSTQLLLRHGSSVQLELLRRHGAKVRGLGHSCFACYLEAVMPGGQSRRLRSVGGSAPATRPPSTDFLL